MDRYLEYLLTKTWVPTYKLDRHESITQEACTQEAEQLESSSSEEVLEVLGYNVLINSQQHAFVEKEASCTLGCIKKSTANRAKDVTLTPCSALAIHMQTLGPGLGHYKHPGVS